MSRIIEINSLKYLSTGIGFCVVLLLSISCANEKENKPLGDVEYFTNPVLDEGPDPYVYLHTDGTYYCMVTRGDRLQLWKSNSFTDLVDAETREIWFPPDTGTNTCCIWAPEIHYFADTWYISYVRRHKNLPAVKK